MSNPPAAGEAGKSGAAGMSQDDIRAHYEREWSAASASAASSGGDGALAYSSPIEDAVLYPAYEALIRDLSLGARRRVLDVGSGSGRWVRFFARYSPRRLVGVDFAEASVALLRSKYAGPGAVSAGVSADFRHADLTQDSLDLGERFDLINVANVLFHIPEEDKFARALRNIHRHLDAGGRAVTTEYLPAATMRTPWMLVRSRDAFESACAAAGLRVVHVRGFCFFSNDPMGIDGPDDGLRERFNRVRAGVRTLLASPMNESARAFILGLLADVERAAVDYCAQRVAPVQFPSQKLVVLERAA
jgi:SAM-dependent methyltransferase